MKLTTRFFFLAFPIWAGTALAVSCGDSQQTDGTGGGNEAGASGSSQGGTNASGGMSTDGGEAGSDRGGSGGNSGDAGAPSGGSAQGGEPGSGGEGGSDGGASGSGAGGEGGESATGGSGGSMAGGPGTAGGGMGGAAGSVGGAGAGGAGAGGAGAGGAGTGGAGVGGDAGSAGGGIAGASGDGGIGGAGGMAGTGGGPPAGCFRIDPLTWVRTLYEDYTPYPWGMQDGGTTITAARYNWVGWFEYDIVFPSSGNFRITVRSADDGWHEGQSDELYNHFAVSVAGVSRLDFDANVSTYDDGHAAVGDLSFHDSTGPVFAASAGPQVVRFDNISDNWINGDDVQIHIAYIQICSVP